MAKVCPLVSIHGTVWYSVRYWIPLLPVDVEVEILAVGAGALTFSASPSSPAARYRYFMTSFPRPAEVAADAIEELAAVAAVLIVPSTSATWTGMS